MRTILIALTLASSFIRAEDSKKSIDRALDAKYRVTTVSAEGDTVLQGVTLTLRKSGLSGGAGTVVNEYKDGAITLSKVSKARKFAGIPGVGLIPGVGSYAAAGAQQMRAFVPGEKMYVTKIEVKDSINFDLISDPISDVRYKAELKFVFPKGSPLELAEVEQAIAEVFKIGGAAAAASASTQPAAAAQPQAAPAPVQTATALAPILPPPPVAPDRPRLAPIAPPAAPAPDQPGLAPIAPPAPPSDQPTAVAAGMSVDQVVAMLGQPLSVADLGPKKLYTFKTLKVTFVDGKVNEFHNPGESPADVTATEPSSFSPVLISSIVIGLGIVGAAVFLLMRGRKPVLEPPPPPVPVVAANPVQAPRYPPAAPQPLHHSPPQPPAQASPHPSPPPSPVPAQAVNRQQELKVLLDLGVLNLEEFNRETAKLSPPVSMPPPPAPPAAAPAPTSIALGQTTAQVMAILGPPQNIVDLGAKKIFLYPALKITFRDGMVSDVD